MKLQRNNKYNGKIIKNIAASLLACSTMAGCVNSTLIEPPVPTVEPAPIIIETPVPTIESTPMPTEVPEETQDVIIVDYKLIEPLSDEEYNEALQKMNLQHSDSKIESSTLSTACLFVNDEPKVLFGQVKYTSDPTKFIFVELTSGEEMFHYTDNTEDGWTCMNYDPGVDLTEVSIEFEPKHPIIANNDVRLCLVGSRGYMGNFMFDVGYYVDREYMRSMIPDNKSGQYYTIGEYISAYLHVLPKEMWITGEDMELAKTEGEKTIG